MDGAVENREERKSVLYDVRAKRGHSYGARVAGFRVTMAFCMSALSAAMPAVGVRTSGTSRVSRAQAPMTLSGSLSSSVTLRSEGE